MTRIANHTARARLAAAQRTIASIDEDITSLRQTLNRLGEASDWRDQRIGALEDEITFWVRQNAQNRAELPLLRLQAAQEMAAKPRTHQELTVAGQKRMGGRARAQSRKSVKKEATA